MAPGFREASGVHQIVDALAGIQNALRAALGELLRAAHRQRLGVLLFQLLYDVSRRHRRLTSHVSSVTQDPSRFIRL